MERHPAVHARGELHVMGCDQGRKPGRPDDRLKRREHMVRGLRIEISGRLVGEQEARPIGDRAGDRDALLLAAGKFRGSDGSPWPTIQDSRSNWVARSLASRRGQPAIICGSMIFSSAENSGSK